MNHRYQRDLGACGLTGVIHRKRELLPGSEIIKSICLMDDRGNGLGAGYAAYGIYPEFKDHYAFHIMYNTLESKKRAESYLGHHYRIDKQEEIPTRAERDISSPPILWRYFLKLENERASTGAGKITPQDFVVKTVMEINTEIEGTYIFSSGKNMGVFKGVGFPSQIAKFYCIEDYEAYIWTAHNRFPTNTPGWWGGAHPFSLLDWTVVHNGEISSYGINKRYLEMYDYRCTLMTDTEVMAYLFDLLVRRHNLPLRLACAALAPPFWKNIELMSEAEKNFMNMLRIVYGSALVNGPFAILVGSANCLLGLNDRIKLRPLVVGQKGDLVYMASEESAIREICPEPDKIWAPRGGEPVIVYLEGEEDERWNGEVGQG